MSFSPKRRWFGAATTAAVLTLAGCGSTAGGSGSTLTFVSFGGDYQKAQSAAMVKPYQEANKGIKLIEDQPTDYAKIKIMVESKIVSADVVDADPFFPIGNCDKYAEKLDYSVIDTTKMPKAFVSDCAVPSMTYAYVMMYNTEKYGDNPPKSWADFFDTTKFPGTRAIENAYIGGGLEEALLADGVAADKLYPLDYDRAFKKLDTIKKDLKFWKTGAEAQQMMENKQADIVVAWSGRAYNAVKNGAPYAPQWNQHFATYDVFMVPKGTKNKEAAMKFIAYATGPVAQANLTEHIPYAPINSDAKPNVDAETAKFLPSQPEIAAQGIPIDHKWYAENQADASAKWTKWTTG